MIRALLEYQTRPMNRASIRYSWLQYYLQNVFVIDPVLDSGPPEELVFFLFLLSIHAFQKLYCLGPPEKWNPVQITYIL